MAEDRRLQPSPSLVLGGAAEGGFPRDCSCTSEIGSRSMAIGRRPIPRTYGAQASADSAGLSCVEAASATPLATPAGLSISCIDLGRRELSVVSGGGAAALTRDGRVWFPEAVGSISERVIRSDAFPSGTGPAA